MCSTCGCASGERKIEGDDPHHDHNHHHDHPHDHHHDNDHHHGHDHHDHGLSHQDDNQGQTVIIHHHYYHQGDVHNHYHQYEPAPVEAKSKKHKHKHKHKHVYQTLESSFKPAGEHHDLDYTTGRQGLMHRGLVKNACCKSKWMY
ncbi:hypothetical protein G9396_01545 [Providencia rettgeri]|nr:hypothetical protein G9396_01545 [Providencia rettgeri]